MSLLSQSNEEEASQHFNRYHLTTMLIFFNIRTQDNFTVYIHTIYIHRTLDVDISTSQYISWAQVNKQNISILNSSNKYTIIQHHNQFIKNIQRAKPHITILFSEMMPPSINKMMKLQRKGNQNQSIKFGVLIEPMTPCELT